MLTSRKISVTGSMPCLLLLLYVWVAIDYCVAFSASPPATLPTGSNSNRYKLYRARYPLEGGPPQLRLHVAVIVQEIRTNEGEETKDPALVLFDFLPQAPTALETTATLLSGGDVKGNLRERELRRIPRRAVCVGDTNASLQDMRKFVSNYPDRLSLVSNSCVTFVDAFIARHKMG